MKQYNTCSESCRQGKGGKSTTEARLPPPLWLNIVVKNASLLQCEKEEGRNYEHKAANN